MTQECDGSSAIRVLVSTLAARVCLLRVLAEARVLRGSTVDLLTSSAPVEATAAIRNTTKQAFDGDDTVLGVGGILVLNLDHNCFALRISPFRGLIAGASNIVEEIFP